jgi:protein-S-isoprenylcysteine O-methyltransferase Ste14
MNWKIASVVAFVLLVGCLAVLGFSRSLLGNGPFTIAVQIAAAGLMIWARVTFGMRSFHATADPTSGGIVTKGPYHFIRHPIYASIFYFLLAGAVAHPSFLSLPVALFAAAMLFVRMRSEEQLLLERYPEYGPYAASTKRVLPGVF